MNLIMSAQQQQQQAAAVSGSELVFSQDKSRKNKACLKHNGVYVSLLLKFYVFIPILLYIKFICNYLNIDL